MTVDCDSHIKIIYIDKGNKIEEWRNIPIMEWIKMMEVLLPKSINDRYFETDYRGKISKKRYVNAKKYYKEVCKKFRQCDTSDND